MLVLNGKTAVFLAVLVIVKGQTKYSPYYKRNYHFGKLGKDELDDQWCKADTFDLKLPDIDPAKIIKLFPGLFHTETEMKEIEKTEDTIREQDMKFETQHYNKILSLPGDGGSCCVTKQETFSNLTLRNMQGELRYLVKLINQPMEQLQYIPHGLCMEGGQCTGRCIQEFRTYPLLVYDTQSNSNPPVKFEYFNIPSYCSCKNV